MRLPTGAPHWTIEFAAVIGLAAGMALLPLLARLTPPVQTFALRDCPAPEALERRIVYLHRRGADLIAECGPVVGARGALKVKVAR